ncbi:hypothetical protein Hanom_Chr07g00611711 [Helianthus anomalus]
MFAGVLRNLGIDHEENKPKRVRKKKVTVAEGVAQKMLEVTGATSDVVWKASSERGGQRAELWKHWCERKILRHDPHSNSCRRREADLGIVELIRKNTSKRPREETKCETAPRAKKVATGKPAIGKKGTPRTLYTDVSTEKVPARPMIIVIPLKVASTVGEEVVGVKKPFKKTEEVQKSVEKTP